MYMSAPVCVYMYVCMYLINCTDGNNFVVVKESFRVL